MTDSSDLEPSIIATCELHAFTEERLAEVKASWLNIAGHDVFAVELAPTSDWAATHIVPTQGDSVALELRDTTSGDCVAIVDVVDSDMRRMSKLLKIHVSPTVWFLEGPDLIKTVATIYSAAYTRVITAGLHKQVRQVKIYGRNEVLLGVLRALNENWPLNEHGLTGAMHGRWFVVTDQNWST